RVFGAMLDITERKRAEEELKKYQGHLEDLVKQRTGALVVAMDRAEAANRAKSAFLANMSHELRAPLNSILGIAQLLRRDREFPPNQRQFLEILSRSGQQLFELIDDILEISKIESGQMTASVKTFDLHSFLEELAEMMILRAEAKSVDLAFEQGSEVPKYIQTDGRKLRQILINLLGNAIKFTEKGSVTLRTRVGNGFAPSDAGSPVRLEFEVEDTGLGIAEKDLESIFEPFMQLSIGHKPSGGVGLGLAISRKFAALLGGEITVSSRVGGGSTFRLGITVNAGEISDVPAREIRRQATGLASGQPGYRLLVVDDHMESRLLLRHLLEPVGFRVLEAAGGREAVDLVQKENPHLVWMDIRMPGMNGYEAARKIRELERKRGKGEGQDRHVPIIAFTAGVMENAGVTPPPGLFDDWVYKPFREEEVFERLEKHLGVQFVYRDTGGQGRGEKKTRDKAPLTPADLELLPAEWLKEFFKTARKGRSRELLKMIDGIRPEHGNVAQDLAELVRVHQFDRLISLCEATPKEHSNG
ncbi:MAG TPA: ATP-binding protein, partial [Thermodesulfobacteriota bacterium]|nr:ATP-binding protein [Thermodesulfobacteriota bacterium]